MRSTPSAIGSGMSPNKQAKRRFTPIHQNKYRRRWRSHSNSFQYFRARIHRQSKIVVWIVIISEQQQHKKEKVIRNYLTKRRALTTLLETRVCRSTAVITFSTLKGTFARGRRSEARWLSTRSLTTKKNRSTCTTWNLFPNYRTCRFRWEFTTTVSSLKKLGPEWLLITPRISGVCTLRFSEQAQQRKWRYYRFKLNLLSLFDLFD